MWCSLKLCIVLSLLHCTLSASIRGCHDNQQQVVCTGVVDVIPAAAKYTEVLFDSIEELILNDHYIVNKSLDNLELIEIINSNIKYMSSKAFEGLVGPKEIVLRNNVIEKIEGSPFRNVYDLHLLTLDNNTLTYTDEFLNLGWPELQIVSSGLTKLPVIQALSLEYLNLRDNELTDFTGIENFTDLYEINLSMNNIKSITINSDSLEQINLSHNFINKIENLNISECSMLDLSYNLIGSIQKLENMDYLWSLNLSYNVLEIIDADAFAKLDLLENLDLSNNEINELNKDVFTYNVQLSKLILSHNHLQNLDLEVNSLQILKADNNEIIGTEFLDGFPNLVILDLSYNNIEVLESMSSLKKLVKLDLSHNQIKVITPRTFLYTRIINIDMSYNMLTDGRSLKYFEESEGLKYLNLSHNKLDRFESFPCAKDSTLDLSYNNIKTINVTHHDTNLQGSNIIFDNNSLNCTQDIVHQMISLHSSMMDDSDISFIDKLEQMINAVCGADDDNWDFSDEMLVNEEDAELPPFNVIIEDESPQDESEEKIVTLPVVDSAENIDEIDELLEKSVRDGEKTLLTDLLDDSVRTAMENEPYDVDEDNDIIIEHISARVSAFNWITISLLLLGLLLTLLILNIIILLFRRRHVVQANGSGPSSPRKQIYTQLYNEKIYKDTTCLNEEGESRASEKLWIPKPNLNRIFTHERIKDVLYNFGFARRPQGMQPVSIIVPPVDA